MLIIPAIDIKEGCVVRFTQGKFDKKVYSRDPLKTAKHWAKLGAELIHVVDLDGACGGLARNIDIAKDIAANCGVAIEFGGGARSIAIIKDLLNCGVARVVLGTRAVQDRKFLEQAFVRFADKVIVSIDTKLDDILIKGWEAGSQGVEVFDFLRTLKKIGFREFIYTDILKDGTLKGPSIQNIKRLLKESGMKIIASGGISCLDDIRKLKALEKQGVSGVIIGKALYEGRFTLKEALKSA